MRGDVMVWMGRLVAGVFLLGLLAVAGAVAVLVRQAEGVPPLPILAGAVLAVALVLLAGACLAMISIAVSARRGVVALQALAAPVPVAVPAEEADEPVGPFTPSGLREVVAPPRPARPAGRVLVAER